MLNTVGITPVDLSKILGGQTKNIGRQKVAQMINAWAFLNYWGHVPGLPPKSKPMVGIDFNDLLYTFWSIGGAKAS